MSFRKLAVLICVVLLVACASSGDYERGDISERIKEDKAWYCGQGMMGFRAVGRFVARWVFQIPVPNVCKVIDVIVEEDA